MPNNRIEEVAKIIKQNFQFKYEFEPSAKYRMEARPVFNFTEAAQKIDALYSKEVNKHKEAAAHFEMELFCLKSKLKAVDARFEKAVDNLCKCGDCIVCDYQAEIRKRWGG